MDIEGYWAAVFAQDPEGMRRFFRPDAQVNWHCTNERFTVEEFIRANCQYPGEWQGTVERTERSGDLAVTVVKVAPKAGGPTFHAVSFLRLEEGKIAALDEYWSDDAPPPQWRQDMHLGTALC